MSGITSSPSAVSSGGAVAESPTICGSEEQGTQLLSQSSDGSALNTSNSNTAKPANDEPMSLQSRIPG